MITWAEGVISVAEPMSVCSGSGVVVGSGLVLPVSPCHTTDGLKSLSRKMFRWDRVALSTDGGEDIGRLIVLPDDMMKFKPLEPS